MEIPERSAALARCINRFGLRLMVEVGTADGTNASAILASVSDPDFRMVCIDPYVAYDEYKDDFDNNAIQERMDENKKKAYATAFKDGRCEHLGMFSVDAAREFRDGSLDLVFIDANHEEGPSYADIVAWYPKVKPGRFIVGHDYSKPQFGVKAAVHRFARENGLEVSSAPQDCWQMTRK